MLNLALRAASNRMTEFERHCKDRAIQHEGSAGKAARTHHSYRCLLWNACGGRVRSNSSSRSASGRREREDI